VLGYCVAGTCVEDEHGCDGAKYGDEGLRGVKSSAEGMGDVGVSLRLCFGQGRMLQLFRQRLR
jgi:hypothetical protein